MTRVARPTNKSVASSLRCVRSWGSTSRLSPLDRGSTSTSSLQIEADTHSANVDELSDLVFALGVTITALTRRVDP
jgi:hypothetical protein